VADSTTPGVPATGSLLTDALLPAGTTASVAGFSVPGSDTIYPAGSTVPVVDPVTGTVTGTVQVNPDGSYVFSPTPGYTGPVPTIDALVTSSDGQSVQVPLSITVNPVLTDASESRTITAGSGPLTLNVLDNTVPPPGTTVSVTSFSLPGSSVVYPVNSAPVSGMDPVTGTVTLSNLISAPRGTAAPQQGDTLSASQNLADADGLGAISWEWLRDGLPIAGATADTYTLTQADVGFTLRARATETDALGTTESVSSAATGAIANVNDSVTGTVTVANLTSPARGTASRKDRKTPISTQNSTEIATADSAVTPTITLSKRVARQ
jgi:hypothetical protein